MAEVVGTLRAIFTADTSGFNTALSGAATKLKDVDKDLKGAATSLGGMEKAAGSAGGGIGSLMGPLKTVGALAGVSFSAQAVIGFGKSIVDAAGEAVDLSAKLGISTQAVQQFKFAADQTGTNINTVGGAIVKMNNALVEGKSGTVQALQAAGLSLADIRNMRPEDAFLAITDAVKKIPDPMLQTQIAMELFGKSGAELLPAIKQGFRETAEGASYMSDAAVTAFDDMADGLATLGNNIKNWSGNAVAAMDDFFRPLSHWMRGGLGIGDVTKDIVGDLNNLTAGLRGASDMSKALIPPTADLAKIMKEQDAALAPVIKKMNEKLKADEAAAKATQQHTDAIKALADQYSGRAIDQKIADAAAAVTQLGGAMAMNATQATQLAAEIAKWDAAGHTIPPTLREVQAAATAVWAANLKMSDSIKVVSLDLDTLKGKVIPVSQAFRDMEFATSLATQGMVGMGVEVNTMSAVQLPKLATTITSMSPYLDQQRAKTQAWGASLSQLGGIFGQFGGQAGSALGHVADQFGRAVEAGGNFATGMKNFSSFSVQSIGNIANAAQGVMSMINSMQGMTKSHAQNAPSKWGAAGQGAMQGAQVGMMFGPWGAAVGAGVGAIAGFLTASSVATKANDVRDDLQKQFGGFGAAQKVIGDFGNDPVLMETYGNFYTAGTAGAVQDNYAAFTDRLKELTEMRDNPPAPASPWGGPQTGGYPPDWGWAPTGIEPPSFQNAPLHAVTGAGVAMLHPGDIVGVPPDNGAMVGALHNIERMLARQSVELAVTVRSAIQTA